MTDLLALKLAGTLIPGGGGGVAVGTRLPLDAAP